MQFLRGARQISTITVGYYAFAAVYDPANGYVYIANSGGDSVSVINGTTVVATVPVGTGPDAMAFDPGNAEVFVANGGSNNVSAIYGTRVVATIPVGTNPTALTSDGQNGSAYVVNSGSNNVSFINGTTEKVVATVPVGSNPVAIAYDSGSGLLYVANANSNNVSVIPKLGYLVPSISSFTASPSTIPLGGTTYLNVTVSGGFQPLSYSYAGMPSPCRSLDSNRVVCAPSSAGGPYNVTVTVTDSGSPRRTATANASFSVTSTAAVLSGVSISPSSHTLQAGTAANFTASLTCTGGGTCPSGTTYSWSLTNKLATLDTTTGNPVKVTAGSTAGTVSRTP